MSMCAGHAARHGGMGLMAAAQMSPSTWETKSSENAPSALMIMSPAWKPMAQSALSKIICAVEASVSMSLVEPSPARMRSMSAAHAVRPTRHGVHFPHDSDRNNLVRAAVNSTGHWSGDSAATRRATTCDRSSNPVTAGGRVSTVRRDMQTPLFACRMSSSYPAQHTHGNYETAPDPHTECAISACRRAGGRRATRRRAENANRAGEAPADGTHAVSRSASASTRRSRRSHYRAAPRAVFAQIGDAPPCFTCGRYGSVPGARVHGQPHGASSRSRWTTRDEREAGKRRDNA